MATANQINAQKMENERNLRSQELTETKRSNRVKEAQGWNKVAQGYIKNASDVGGTVGKIIGAVNDPSWYNKDKQLVNDAASISYLGAIGLIQDFGRSIKEINSDTIIVDNRKDSIAGFMGLPFVPTLGPDQDNNATNVASQNIYAFVRHMNSGHANYEPVDLMMYLLGMDSMYTYYAWMIRLYSLLKTAKTENRYYPVGAIKAIVPKLSATFDPSSIDLAKFRTYINLYANRVRIFNVPADFPYFTRHIWMTSNIFKDFQIKKSSEYLFTPKVYYTWDDTNGKLDAHAMIGFAGGLELTLDNIITVGNSIINSYLSSEDFGIMSGDILKAYGDRLFTISDIPENFHIESTYSEEVLSQIAGATIYYSGPLGNNPDIVVQSASIYQYKAADAGYDTHKGKIFQGWRGSDPVEKPKTVIYEPGIHVGDRSVAIDVDRSKHIVSMYKDNVTPDDNMVATRLSGTTKFKAVSTEEPNVILAMADICGSEIISGCYFVRYDINETSGLPELITFRYHDGKVYNFTSATTVEEFSTTLVELANFSFMASKLDWIPRLRLLLCDTSDLSKSHIIADNFDTANYAIIDPETLRNMHYVAINSEFNIPATGNKGRR